MIDVWQKITNKKDWNMIASSVPHSQFLQSWEWGEFQSECGRDVLRLSWKDQVLLQCVKMPLGFGKYYWYIPRGPVEIEPSEKRIALQELGRELKTRGVVFARIDPLKSDFWVPQVGNIQEISNSVQPRCVRVLDITIPEKEYFEKEVNQKTRYNIRLSERRGVEIRSGEINNFLNLNAQTTKRNNFVSHPNWYYIKMVKTLSKNRAKWSECSIKIWEATYKGVVVASNLIIYFGDTMTYSHGASSSKYRNVMAPYLLRWKIIKDGISHGYKFHDLGGVNPEEESEMYYKKSWEGISQFKKGFGGSVRCYPSSSDLIYGNFYYSVYKMAKRARRIRHGVL